MISSKLKHNERLETKARLDKNLLRQRRAIALKAFDIYKTNALYVYVVEDPDVHGLIMEWYNAVLAIEEDPEAAARALDNIPIQIAHYM